MSFDKSQVRSQMPKHVDLHVKAMLGLPAYAVAYVVGTSFFQLKEVKLKCVR